MMRVFFLSRFRCQWLYAMVMLFVVGTSSAFGAETKEVVSGQSNYNAKCTRCHGVSGKGNGLQALVLFFMLKMVDFTDPTYMQTRSDEDLFRAIKQGSKAGMPAFGLKLSEPEIKDLVVYIRSFTKAPEPVKSAGAAH